ncbi:MAG: glycoside hydrolase family 127 protein [Phycisphaerae bacterium]|mgnify:CR=1 FL=1|nr:glycoside hydrolase family 127 protein [Phycisphaerae bacterium]
MTRAWMWVSAVLLGLCQVGASAAEPTHAKLRPVSFGKVTIQDSFWSPRIEANRTVTLPHSLKHCENTGRISNFAKAGKLIEGEFEGIYFNDSDLYKVLEGAAYSLALHPDPQLEARIDSIIDQIASAQQPDGYLNTYFTLKEPDKRWTDLAKMHELYCAGHLFEAAVAYYEATGKRKLLDVACRFADHIDTVFGPGKKIGYSGHEEIELALIKLARVTGEQRYRKLAEWFVEIRGQNRDPKEEYCQAHLPVAEQSEIVGHAVRAMYLYAAVADIAGLTGRRDYIEAMDRLWLNVTGRKLYLTGGIGAEARNEGFSADFDLPNDSAYAETCAAIGLAMWSHRLLLLHGEGRFTDILERTLYNGILSGVAMAGDKFFYVNPLASRGRHHRQPWYGCACCPTNVVRFIPALGGYIYATSDDGAWVNLYVASGAEMDIGGNTVKLKQETKYPWSGQVRIAVEPAKEAVFSVNLHIPAWCEQFQAKVNGSVLPKLRQGVEHGYLTIRRNWKPGDVVELDLAMPVVRVQANPRVQANVGRLALQRGPLVYCLEGVDHGGKVRNMAIPRAATINERHEPALLGGIVVLTGEGLAIDAVDWTESLYRPALGGRPVTLTAVPYYAWDHREPGEMVVWIPEAIGIAEVPPPPTRVSDATVTASHCFERDTVAAVNDGAIPAYSHDGGIPRFTWYPHRGTQEWIEYSLPRPQLVDKVDVYWWDDAATGGNCRVPQSWRLMWKRGDAWEPVKVHGAAPVRKDDWSRVTFDPVPTMGLRIEVRLQENYSGGILEWRVP